MTTVFVRFSGSGRMPPLSEAVTYELCVDAASGHLVQARPEGAEPGPDDRIGNILRAWQWGAKSSMRLGSGVLCWLQRFEPATDDKGQPAVRSTPVLPVRWLRLDHEESFQLHEVQASAAGEDTVAFIRMVEQGGIRFVILEPRLWPQVSAGPQAPAYPEDRPRIVIIKEKLEGELPRLPDLVKVPFRHSTLTGSYRVCVGVDGQVQWVEPEVPLLGANRVIVNVLKTWRFKPQPIPLCYQEIFMYVIE